MGQKLGELVAYISAVCLGAENLDVVGKLGQELAAGTAGSGPVFAVCIDGQTLELSAALADCLDAGSALGTDGAAESGIFNVTAGEYAAVCTFESCANGKTGIGDICVDGGLLGHG